MTLAIALTACVLAALACSVLATSATPRGRRVLTFVAVIVPLAMLGSILRRHRDASPADTFQVVGQFAPAADTLVIGRGSAADIRVSNIDADSSAVVRLIPDGAAERLRVEATPGMTVVFDGDRPINAARIGRRAAITLFGRDTVRLDVRTPRWPLSCLAGWERRCARRVVSMTGAAGTKRFDVRLTEIGVNEATFRTATSPRFVLFRSGGRAYIASTDPEELLVDGQALPAGGTIAGDSIILGRGSAATTLVLRVERAAHRRLVLYDEHLASSRWRLEGERGRRLFVVNASDSVAAAPGTLPLIELGDWPLGPRASAYSGVLEQTDGGWWWRHDGVSARVPANTTMEWPSDTGAKLRGHVVRLRHASLAANPIVAIAVLWVGGALVLAFGAGVAGGVHPALRTGLLGLAYTLAFVRALLAVRVSQAPPFLTDATTTVIALLCALPACVALIEAWPRLWSAITDRERSLVRRAALGVGAVALAPVAAFAASGWNVQIALLTATVVVAATGGLVAVQHVLGSRSHRRSMSATPLAMLESPEQGDLGLVQLIRAVATLLVLVAFYVELELARRIPWWVIGAAHAAMVAAVWWFFELRSRVLPRLSPRTIATRAAAGVAAAILVVGTIVASEIAPDASVLRSFGVVTAALLAAVAIVAVVCQPFFRSVSGNVYARHDVLPPTTFLLAPIAGLTLSGVPVVRRFGITLGFALALVAVLVVVRVLTLLWHHDTRQRIRLLFNADGRRVSTRAILLTSALALTLLAGHSIDLGLLQLLLLVVIVTMTAAAAMLGRRALVAPLLLTASLIGVWVMALRVTPAELESRPVSLSTPRIRYAAATEPEALQRQLVFTDGEHGRQIVNTLIQEWGIRSHAALGRTRGGGLFSLGFAEGAIRAREAVTDNAFSVFVLSEHGFAGGAAVIGIYLTLAVVLLAGAVVAGRAFVEVPRALLLTSCAALLLVPAYYMIGANVGSLALTGQNLPLLGLRSGADVALFCWIVALAIAAFPAADREAARDPQRDDEYMAPMRRLRATVAGIAVASFVLAAALTWPMWRATHADVDPTFRLDAFRGALDDLAARRMLVASNGEVSIAPTAPPALRDPRSLLTRIVRTANGDAAARSPHCLDRGAWLRPRKDEVDVGDGCTIVMSLNGRTGWLGELTTAPRGSELVMNDGTRSVAMDAHHPRKRGDIVAEGRATLVVDSVPRAAMAFARWRNGEMARAVGAGTLPLFARLDSLLSRGFRPASIPATAPVELTVEPKLVAAIQQGLDSACTAVRQCAVTLVNPERGDILALASHVDSSVRVGAYAPLDASFRGHRAASVIKPIIASAVLARYPSLQTLVVDQPQERIQSAAGWRLPGGELRSPFRGCPTENRRIVGWSCFLPTSNNLFAITLGFLGAAETARDGMPEIEPGSVGPAFSIAGRHVSGRPKFHVVEGSRRYDDSPLARGLSDLFDAEIGRTVGLYDTTLWAPLTSRGWLKLNGAWQRVSPEVPQLPLGDPSFRDLHRLAGFMIGETDNNWSNIALARAVSRIFTGRGVQLRLIRRVGSVPLAPTEKQGVSFGPARAAVLEGMSGVVRGYGTAHTLAASLPGRGFRFVGKTGTLDSQGLRQVSGFMFAAASPGPAELCSVAGVIFVEMPDGATAAQPSAKELFATIVARALASQGPWHDARCRGAAEVNRPMLAGEPARTGRESVQERERGTHDESPDHRPARRTDQNDRRRRRN
jgi:cell division protein FtsW (lipid II flippase)